MLAPDLISAVMGVVRVPNSMAQGVDGRVPASAPVPFGTIVVAAPLFVLVCDTGSEAPGVGAAFGAVVALVPRYSWAGVVVAATWRAISC